MTEENENKIEETGGEQPQEATKPQEAAADSGEAGASTTTPPTAETAAAAAEGTGEEKQSKPTTEENNAATNEKDNKAETTKAKPPSQGLSILESLLNEQKSSDDLSLDAFSAFSLNPEQEQEDKGKDDVISSNPRLSKIKGIIEENPVDEIVAEDQTYHDEEEENMNYLESEDEEEEEEEEDTRNRYIANPRANRRPRFTFQTLRSRLHNKILEKDISKPENKIKYVMYVKEREDAKPKDINQLLILFQDNSFYYRGKLYKTLVESHDHKMKFIRVFLDPTGNHMIVTKKVQFKNDPLPSFSHYYLNMSREKGEPLKRNFVLQGTKPNEFISSVGWNLLDTTNLKTGNFIIGTSEKNLYVTNIICSFGRSSGAAKVMTEHLRDLVPAREAVTVEKIIGIDVERIPMSRGKEGKKSYCYVLVASSDALYEFSGEWRETDPYSFIKSAYIDGVTIVHPSIIDQPRLDFHIVYEKIETKNKYKNQSKSKKKAQIYPMYQEYKKKALIMTSTNGIFHARLKYYDMHIYGFENVQSCIVDAEYIVYSDDERDRYWNGVPGTRAQDVPLQPFSVVPSPNHILMIVPQQQTVEELVIADFPPDLCGRDQDLQSLRGLRTISGQEEGKKMTQQLRPFCRAPIKDTRVIDRRRFGKLMLFAQNPFFDLGDTIYAVGPDMIIEISLTVNENNDIWEKYYDRANEYLELKNQLKIIGQSESIPRSTIHKLISKEISPDYFILTFHALKNEIGSLKRRDMVIQSLAQFYFDSGNYMSSAILFSGTRKPVPTVVDQFIQEHQMKPLRKYLMLKYGYLTPYGSEIREQLGRKIQDAFSLAYDAEMQRSKNPPDVMVNQKSYSNYVKNTAGAMTDAEVVSLIVELYMEEINVLHEEWDLTDYTSDFERKRNLALEIKALKQDLKKNFLSKIAGNTETITRMDKDRIYKLIMSHGHLRSAVKYSAEVKDFDKVLSFFVSKSYETSTIAPDAIDILQKLPDHTPKERSHAKDMFIKYAGCINSYSPTELSNVLAQKSFLNSMLLLPPLSNYGEYLHRSEADMNMMGSVHSNVHSEEGHMDSVDDGEINKDIPTIHKAYQYYEKALQHALDVTKGDSQEQKYVMNTLITLYSRLSSSKKFIECMSRSEMSTENKEFALRRALLPDGVAFTNFMWNIPQEKQLEIEKANRENNRSPAYIKQLSGFIRGNHAAAICFHRLGINSTAIDHALTAAYGAKPMNDIKEEFLVRDNLLQTAFKIANSPLHYHDNKNTDEDYNYLSIKEHMQPQKYKLWVKILKRLTKYEPLKHILPASLLQNTVDERHNFLKGSYSSDIADVLNSATELTLYEVLSSIHADTPIAKFKNPIVKAISNAPRIKKLSSTFVNQDLRFTRDDPSTYIEVHSNHKCNSFTCKHTKQNSYIFSQSKMNYSRDAKGESFQQPLQFFSFKCGHVFHDDCLESMILNSPMLVIKSGKKTFNNPILTSGGEQALVDSDSEILPIEVNLTKVRLEQLRAREHSLNLEMKADMIKYASIFKKFGHNPEESTSTLGGIFGFSGTKSSMQQLMKELREHPLWKKRREGLFKRILKRIWLKCERSKLLSKSCPLCGTIIIPEIHLGFIDDNKSNEWSVDPVQVPDYSEHLDLDA